eukprot:Pgem_evm1s1207
MAYDGGHGGLLLLSVAAACAMCEDEQILLDSIDISQYKTSNNGLTSNSLPTLAQNPLFPQRALINNIVVLPSKTNYTESLSTLSPSLPKNDHRLNYDYAHTPSTSTSSIDSSPSSLLAPLSPSTTSTPLSLSSLQSTAYLKQLQYNMDYS